MAKRIKPNGLWVGDNGDELSLATTQRGEVVGVYRDQSEGQSKEYPLCGFVQGSHLAFSISLDDRGALASWTGVLGLDAEGARIDAQWSVLGETPAGPVSRLLQRRRRGATRFRMAARRRTNDSLPVGINSAVPDHLTQL